jgi:hypothetical protein
LGVANLGGGIDASGDDIFFESMAHLVPGVAGTQPVLYDARVGGGFPAAVVQRVCEGASCQGGPGGGTEYGLPGSGVSGGEGLSGVVVKPPVVSPPPGLSRAQLLARALRVCRGGSRRARRGCEARARRRYGVKRVKGKR